MANIIKNPRKAHGVELYALQPDLTAEQVASKIGVDVQTVYIWRRDPNFIDAIYKRYMTEFGGELPAVLSAMVREAKSGNVQAGRLVLEHSGKLVKNVNVTVDSPFEKWLKKVELADEAEIVDADFDDAPIEVDLPPRNEESQIKRATRENSKLKDEIRREQYNRKQREWYKWKKRAKAVGVQPLKARRPTAGQRKEWQEEIIRRENEKKDS